MIQADWTERDLHTQAEAAVAGEDIEYLDPRVLPPHYVELAKAFLALEAASGALLDKMDAVDAAGLDGVFQMAAIHGMPWRGPDWKAERERLAELVGHGKA